jgi:5-methylcytosine-specific restriction endonuclease McrA
VLRRTPFKRTTPLRRHPRRPLQKSVRRKLKDELDRITSLLVRARDRRCVTCGTTENLECSHYFKRGYLATRWNLTNCNAQCSRENGIHNVNPFKYRAYMVKLIGEDGLDELFKLRNSVWRPTDDELRSLLESHRTLLRTMKRAA